MLITTQGGKVKVVTGREFYLNTSYTRYLLEPEHIKLPVKGEITKRLCLPHKYSSEEVTFVVGKKIEVRGMKKLGDSFAYFVYADKGHSVLEFTTELMNKCTTIRV